MPVMVEIYTLSNMQTQSKLVIEIKVRTHEQANENSDTKWRSQKLYNFGVSFCRNKSKKKETKECKNIKVSSVPTSHFNTFMHTFHTQTHFLPPSAAILLSPRTDKEARWRTSPWRWMNSSFFVSPCHFRPFSRLVVTVSKVTLPIWLPGTDITNQKWATTLPCLQQNKPTSNFTEQLKMHRNDNTPKNDWSKRISSGQEALLPLAAECFKLICICFTSFCNKCMHWYIRLFTFLLTIFLYWQSGFLPS